MDRWEKDGRVLTVEPDQFGIVRVARETLAELLVVGGFMPVHDHETPEG